MRTFKNIVVLYILVVSFVCHPSCSKDSGSPCNAAMSKQLGNVYALALFYPERFVNYEQQERAALSSSSFRRCLEDVANALSAAAVNMPSRQETYERAMDIASRAGAPQLGPKVTEEMMKNQGNYALVAEALTQLSKVLGGELAYESTIMYETAITFGSLSNLWKVLGAEAELPGFWKKYTQILFELTRWQIERVARILQ